MTKPPVMSKEARDNTRHGLIETLRANAWEQIKKANDYQESANLLPVRHPSRADLRHQRDIALAQAKLANAHADALEAWDILGQPPLPFRDSPLTFLEVAAPDNRPPCHCDTDATRVCLWPNCRKTGRGAGHHP